MDDDNDAFKEGGHFAKGSVLPTATLYINIV